MDEKVLSAECEVRNEECGVRSEECGVRNAECGVVNAECEVRNEECEVRNAECEVRNAECGVRSDGQVLSAECEVRSEECEVRGDEALGEENSTQSVEKEDFSEERARLEAELAREREARELCQNQLLCQRLLDEHGLPRELGEYLATNDAVETEKRVNCVAQIIKSSINEGVLARLETLKSPARGKSSITKKQFNELSLADMQRLYVTDRELYKRLSQKNN